LSQDLDDLALRNLLDRVRVKLKTNLNLFELRQNDLNRLLDAVRLLS
jgi:hypothetical protein